MAQDAVNYLDDSGGLTPPIAREEGHFPSPSALPSSRFPTGSVEHEVAREWQIAESRELMGYTIPYGFHCDPSSSPEGGNWNEACPSSFQWVGHKHGIMYRAATGLEPGLYRDLDRCEAHGLAERRCNFWSLLATLGCGSLLSMTELRDLNELRQIYPDCPISKDERLSHHCLKGWES